MRRPLALFGCLACIGIVGCQDAGVSLNIPPVQSTSQEIATDDSQSSGKANSVDPANDTAKPLQDEDVTINIRQKLIKSDMSHTVQNVQIATQDGQVVLRGLVKSAEEKQRVQMIAESVAGTPNVANWIEVE